MLQIDIKDILSIALKDLPSAVSQKAIVEEIDRLKIRGMTEQQAISLVFDNNKIGNKAH